MIEFLQNNMMKCFWVETFNIECFGCGFQRSIIFLLQGDLKNSLITYPALIPIIILILYLILHFIFKFKNGHRWLVLIFTMIVSIMIINYLIKIF